MSRMKVILIALLFSLSLTQPTCQSQEIDAKLTERFQRLGADTKPRSEVLSSFNTLVEATCPVDDNELAEEFLAVEKRRFQEMPDLETAVRFPFETPLIGSKTRTFEEFMERKELLSKLIDEYARLTLDSDETKAKLLPLFKELINSDEQKETQVGQALLRINSSKDPFYYFCLLRHNNIKNSELFAKAFDSFETREVSPFLQILLAELFFRRLPSPTVEMKGRVIHNAIRGYSQWIRIEQPIELEVVPATSLAFLKNVFGIEALHELLDELARPLTSPTERKVPAWYYHFVAGITYSKIASEARGSEFINQVGAERMKVFEEYSEKSAAHYLKAWVQRPNMVIITTQLMFSQGVASVTPRPTAYWFRQALADILDPPDVLLEMSRYLLTRWGGTNEKQVKLAKLVADCAEKNPAYALNFFIPLKSVWFETGKEFLFEEADLVESVVKLGEELTIAPQPITDTKSIDYLVRVLWDGGKFRTLKGVLEKFDNSQDRLALMQLNDRLVQLFCNAATSKNEKLLKSIQTELYLSTGNRNEFEINQLRRALQKLTEIAESDAERDLLEICNQHLSLLQKFQAGELVELSLDRKKMHWIFQGEFKDESDRSVEIVATTTASDHELLATIRLPQPFQFKATVEPLEVIDDEPGFAISTSKNSVGLESPLKGMQLVYLPQQEVIMWQRVIPNTPRMLEEKFQVDRSLKTITLQIDIGAETAVGFVNEKKLAVVKSNFDNNGQILLTRKTVPVARNPNDRAVSYRISNVSVKRLAEEELPD